MYESIRLHTSAQVATCLMYYNGKAATRLYSYSSRAVLSTSEYWHHTGEWGYNLIFDLYTVFSPAGPANLSPPVAKACLRSWVRFPGGSMRQGPPAAVHEGAP